MEQEDLKLLTLEQFFKTVESREKSNKRILVEIAGKDSVAAILPVLKRKNVSEIICIGINHQGFYGNKSEPYEHYIQIKQLLFQEYPTVKWEFYYLDVSNLFNSVIIRPMAIIQKHFHHYSPCPPCHLFFHMIRIPILDHLGIDILVSGERSAHENKLKLNQIPEVLDLFARFLSEHGKILCQPLKNVSQDEAIFEFLGDSWQNAQPYKCIFSGNYFDENNQIFHDIPELLKALKEFYFPLYTKIVHYIKQHKKEPQSHWIQENIQKIIQNINEI